MKSRLRALVIALVLALFGAAERASAAAPSEASTHAVLVLPLVADGLLARDREALDERLGEAFEHPELTLVPAAATEPCTDEACLRELGREHGATHVVRAEVSADGRDYVASLVVVAVDDDGPAHVIDAGCEICGLAEFNDRLAARAVAARDLILAKPQRGRLEVVSVAENARVRIDGRLRAHPLPYHSELSVGHHELVVSAGGHFRQAVPIEILAGVGHRLEVKLEPKPIHDWRRPTGWALLGTGFGSVLTGSILIGVHGTPAALRCRASEPGLVDTEGDCRWLRRTLGAGVGLTVVGVLAASAGVGLVVSDTRRRRAHELEPELGVRVGLGRFDLQVRF